MSGSILNAHACWLLPGLDKSLHLCAFLWGHRSITGYVEEDEVECHNMGNQTQKHYRVSAITVTLIHDPKYSPSWLNREIVLLRLLWHVHWEQKHNTCDALTDQVFHQHRSKFQRGRLGPWRLLQIGSWPLNTSHTPHCKRWARDLYR